MPTTSEDLVDVQVLGSPALPGHAVKAYAA
jgi:hypothetical protein